MRAILFSILTIIYFAGNAEPAFSHEIPILHLKENKKIDELMCRVVKDGPDPGQIDKSMLSDSCWYLQIFKWDQDNSISFQVKPLSKNLINFTVNKLEDNKQNYGFFIYKGRFILVWTNKELPDLFASTGLHSTYKFLFQTTFDSETEKSMRNSISRHYKMIGGVITVESGPPPMATH